MGLETGNYINDLNVANPTPSDPKSQGDDHLRLIKAADKNTFPGFVGAAFCTGTDVGGANVYAISPATPLLAYSENLTINFVPLNSNTGASTINISALGEIPIQTVDGAALTANDIRAGWPVTLRVNAGVARMTSPTKRYMDALATNAALPGQAGNAGKLLTTDGTNASFTDTFTIALNEAKGADIASAATINLTTATGNLVHVTGTTTITAITIPNGAERTVVFDNALTLTNSANLIIPGGINITTSAGDTMVVRGDGSAARIIAYQRATGDTVRGAGLTLLAIVTPTAVGAVNFLNTFNSTYDCYEIEGIGLKPAANANLLLQLAVAGVADTASNYYNATGVGSVSSTDTSYLVSAGSLAASAGTGINFLAKIQNANSTGLKTGFANAMSATGAAAFSAIQTTFAYQVASAITGFRLLWGAGGPNFQATGAVLVYGRKRTL